MKQLAFILTIAVTGLVFDSAAQSNAAPVADSTVVLKAGSFTLTKAEYERLALGFDRASGAVITGATPQSHQSGMEVARLLAWVTEAQRRKIDQAPNIQALMQVRSYVIQSTALLRALNDEAKQDEAGTRSLWESEKNRYIDVSARHLLIRFAGVEAEAGRTSGLKRTESQARALAQDVQRKLLQGADFAATARRYSDDESTREKGGELPAFTRGAMVAEFESAAFAQPVGKVGELLRTKYGFHLIQVDKRVPYPFERVRTALESMRAKEKFDAIVTNGIELNPAYFKP